MSDKKYVVPDGMAKVAEIACVAELRRLNPGCGIGYATADAMCIVDKVLEAAIRWWAENAPKPELRQCQEMWHAANDDGAEYCREWVRRMFLAPEPEVPDAVKDLLWRPRAHGTRLDEELAQYDAAHDADVLEAYNRGKAGK